MAIESGKTISGLSEITSFGGSEDFVVRLASSNFRAPYSKLLTKISDDLGVSHPLTTTGDIMIYDAIPTRLGVGTAGQFLVVGDSSLPEWSTQTFLSDPTTTNGDIIFNNAGSLDRLPIGSNGNVLTISGGLPSWSGSLYSDPLTTNEDLLIRRTGATTRLPVGSEGQFLKVSSGLLSWGNSPASSLTVNGDILYYNSGDTALPIGTNGQLLRVSSLGFPEWASYTIYTDPLTTNGDILIRTAGASTRLAVGTQDQVLSVQSGETIWTDLTSLLTINDLIDFGTSVTTPSALEDGYVISWNDGISEYELIPNGSGSLSFIGGLNQVGSDVSLGGTAVGNILLDGDSNTYNLSLNEFLSIDLISDGNSTYTSKLSLNSDESLLVHQETVGGPEFSINLGGLSQMIVTDSINSRGLEYAFDYSANFSNESLVSRRYVDDRFQSKLPLSATASSPGAGQDDYILYWDNTAGVYEMKVEAGAGAVTKVGTPVNNQVGVWTGDGTLEGDVNLTFSGSALAIGNTSITSGQITTTTGDLTLQAVAGSDIHINVDSDNLYIDNLATITVAGGDLVLLQDISDSNKIKRVTAASLTGAGTVTFGVAQYQIPITNAGLTDYNYDAQFTYNSNSQLTVDNGTAALPSYTFSGDENTGMYRFGTDAIGFSSNGVIAGKINGSGYDSLVGGILINGTSVISSGRVLQNILQANVDNIRLDANTISSTTGDLSIVPNGASNLILLGGGAGSLFLGTNELFNSSGVPQGGINPMSSVTVAGDDKVWVFDTSDSDNPKTVTAQSIADLASSSLLNISDDTGNSILIGNASTSGPVSLTTQGLDPNINVNIKPKGAGVLDLDNGGINNSITFGGIGNSLGFVEDLIAPSEDAFIISVDGSSKFQLTSNYLGLGAQSGADLNEIRVVGATTNQDLLLTPKGTGTVVTSSAHTSNISAANDVITKGYADSNYGSGIANVVEDLSPQLAADLDSQNFNLDSVNSLYLNEKAAANADISADGQVWVKTATPNELWFTDDAGNDMPVSKNTGWRFGTNATPITLTTAGTWYGMTRSVSDALHYVNGVTSSSTTVTITTSGLYLIGISGGFTGKNDNDVLEMRIQRSSVSILEHSSIAETGNAQTYSTSTVVYLTAGDVLTPAYRNASSSTDSLFASSAKTFWYGTYLGN